MHVKVVLIKNHLKYLYSIKKKNAEVLIKILRRYSKVVPTTDFFESMKQKVEYYSTFSK